MRDRPSSRSDRANVDPRRLDRQADDAALVEHRYLAVADQAGVEARAADVGCDRARQPELARELGRGDGTRDGARDDGLEWPGGGLVERHGAAAGAGDQRLSDEPARAERALEALEVVAHATPDEGVDDGRAGALVLAVLARYLVGERDLAREPEPAELVGNGDLVRTVRVGVQQRDRDRVDPIGLEDRERRGDAGEVDRPVDRPIGQHPLVDGRAQAARDERRRRPPEQVVRVVPIAAPDLEHVAEAAGRDQTDAGAAPLEQRVQSDRRAVQEERGGTDAIGRERRLDGHDHAALRRVGRARLLADDDLSGLVVAPHEVGERAADIDSQERRHGPRQYGLVKTMSCADTTELAVRLWLDHSSLRWPPSRTSPTPSRRSGEAISPDR